MQLPGVELSREHIELTRSGLGLRVRDLGSRNGVWVNGQRVENSLLLEGDMLRIGEWVAFVALGLTPDVKFAELAPGLFGGPRLARLLEHARKLVESDIPLVIQGAAGTGKECVARALHSWSGRSGAFVAVNCAELSESELFGHARGAFTGAHTQRLGIFREADGGTLLLDEFLSLSPAMQAKLLRVLEERVVQPLGESRSHAVDVLLLAATQLPLPDFVHTGQLRSALAARLGVYSVGLPALAQRREDIAPLFKHFTRDAHGHGPTVTSEFVEWLCTQPWEQNVRELAAFAQRMRALHVEAPRLTLAHLPAEYRSRELRAAASCEDTPVPSA